MFRDFIDQAKPRVDTICDIFQILIVLVFF